MSLFLEEIGHLFAYFLAVFVLYKVRPQYLNKVNFVLGILVTFGIDSDHLIDYAIASNWDLSSMSIKGFFSGYYFDFNQKVYVLFHAWEYVVALFLIFALIKEKSRYSWLIVIAVAMLAHIVFDVLSNSFGPEVYMISYRSLQNFDISVFK